MNSKIFGIKINGVSTKIIPLEIEDCQDGYNYICNVEKRRYDNGNGSYEVSFFNSKKEIGLKILGWSIKDAFLRFDWGTSNIVFTMIDPEGNLTNSISAASQKGTVRGYDIEIHIQALFTRVREVISKYHSAVIFNAFDTFYDKMSKVEFLGGYDTNLNPREVIKNFTDDVCKLNAFKESYQILEDLLTDNYKLEGSDELFTEMRAEAVKLIQSIVIKEKD